MRRLNRKSEAGFTLTELLIVVAIMGLVVTAVMGLYVNMQKNTGGTEELVEVQSGVRVGIDWIARDLRMAGFLVAGQDAFTDAQSDRFTMNTATSFNVYARIGEVDPDSTAGLTFTIDPPSMLDLIKGTNEFMRVVRPATAGQPMPEIFAIDSIDRTDHTITLACTDATAAARFVRGDMLLRVRDTDPAGTTDTFSPHTTTYFLTPVTDLLDSPDPAMRELVRASPASGATVITGNITQLAFVYILEDGTTRPIPPATVVAGADLGKIVAVRVVLTGATDATKTGQENYSGVKTRQLSTIVKLRNL